MTIEQLAELILTQTRERLAAQHSQWQADAEQVEIRPGRVYTKIDRGPAHNMGGMLMVENATGIIFGIKGYGQVHKGRRYGTLETVGNWYWGEYHPRPLPTHCYLIERWNRSQLQGPCPSPIPVPEHIVVEAPDAETALSQVEVRDDQTAFVTGHNRARCNPPHPGIN